MWLSILSSPARRLAKPRASLVRGAAVAALVLPGALRAQGSQDEQPDQAEQRTHVVKRGDTLSGLATRHLGHSNRWPDIFALNRGVLTDPDRIVAGQVLQLPSS